MRFLIIISLCLLYTINAQVVTVLDNETNEPLELVTIFSDLPKAITTTNSYGQAELTSFTNSEKITFQLLGYKTKSKSYEEIVENHFYIYLNKSNIALDQVVVSATKWKQTNGEVPSRIAIISPKEVEFQNPQTAADLLNISGEVFIQKSQQGGGSPMLRGFATNRVLLSVDGIRMNNAIFRSGNIQNVISLDAFSIENTEVLFGPGSIIYGSDAIGGSMNFFTLAPKMSLTEKMFITGNAQYRFSNSNRENTGHFDINLGWKNFASLTSISYNSFGNLVMGSNGPNEYLRDEYVKTIDGIDSIVHNSNSRKQLFTDYKQFNLLQKFRYTPNDNWYIDYALHYSRTSNYDRYDRLIRYRNEQLRSAEWYYGPQIWMMNNLTITYLASNLVYDDLAIRIAHQQFEESRNDRDFRDNELRIREENVDVLSLNIDLNKRIDVNSKISYGLEYIYNNVKSAGLNKDIIFNSNTKAPSRYPNSDWHSLAGYFVYQRELNSALEFQTGLRYNFFNLQSDFDTTFFPFPFTSANISNGALTGSIGFIYKPTKQWLLGLNLSTGFRSPNVDDIGKVFDSEPGAVVVPNTNLAPEYAYNAEINVAKIFNEFAKVDLSIYYTYLDNAMVRRDFTISGLDSIIYNGEMSKVQAIQNAANAYIYGVQAGFDLSLSENFELSGNFNYQYGEEELDDGSLSSLRHAAPMFGNLVFNYIERDLRLQLNLIYNGEISYSELAESERSKTFLYAIDENKNPYSPSWYSLNFKMSYKLFTKFLITTGIENITDQRYRPYSSGIAASGRNFIISTKYTF